MTLPELSIRRPVLTIAVSMLATIAGIIGFIALARARVPGHRSADAVGHHDLSRRRRRDHRGADHRAARGGDQHRRRHQVAPLARAARARSQISVEFSLDTNLDAAASDVRDQVARIARQLPARRRLAGRSTKPTPIRSPSSALSISSDRRSQLELGAYADTLRERLQTVPGVAGVDAAGREALRHAPVDRRREAARLRPLAARRARRRQPRERRAAVRPHRGRAPSSSP